ncbi:MAG: methyltransferase [Nannocystaceae bacterium]
MNQPPSPPSPALIKDLATRFMASKLLFAAVELGLFEALGAGASGCEALAERLGVPPRSVAMIADAMTSVGLLVREGDAYRNSPAADFYLAGKTPADMRPLLRMFERLEYPAWQHLTPTLRRGLAPELNEAMDTDTLAVFHAGIDVFTMSAARGLLGTYEFAGRRRVLDVGGGNGSFLRAILGAHPHLEGTLFELPHVIEVATRGFAGSPLQGRVTLIDGDALVDDLPADHDLIIVANVLHLLAPEHIVRLLARLRAVAGEGSELLLIDLWTDATRVDPPLAILMAGEFAIRSNFGDVYPADRAAAWLAETGWSVFDRRSLGPPLSVLMARPS